MNHDVWLWNKPEQAEDAWNTYQREFDTPENRAQLARTMVGDAFNTFDAAAADTLSEYASFLAVTAGWVDAQDGAFVLAWLHRAGTIDDFETWYAQKGDD